MTTTAKPRRPVVQVLSPFTVIIDTREQLPYGFTGLTTNTDKGSTEIDVIIRRQCLKVGDYSIKGHTGRLAIERKSKEDLYGSIGRRANFEGRLERMSKMTDGGGYAAVVVECDLKDLLSPPPFTKLHPKSVNRTILAWRQRYRVDWYFFADRNYAEAFTYRMLERFWLDRQSVLTDTDS